MWNPTHTELRELLADLYPTQAGALRVVRDAGLKPSRVTFSGKAIDTWQSILDEALKHSDMVTRVASAALSDYQEHPLLQRVASGDADHAAPPTEAPNIRKDITWRGDIDSSTLEKIIGARSTLLPIHFLELGLNRSRSVARVTLPNGSGTGFLIRDNLLVTNHHVLPDVEHARRAIAEFNVQKTPDRLDAPIDRHTLDPDRHFWTSPLDQDDLTVVAIAGDANSAWGEIPLTPPQRALSVGDRVLIIQHPSGGPKQIGLYHNTVAYVGPNRLQYLTDTMPGSSGSPVFDNDWSLVGVHHSGGHLRDPGTNNTHYRNEGIPLARLLAGLNP